MLSGWHPGMFFFPHFSPFASPPRTPQGLSSPWPAAATHHPKGELGPAAFSQIQRCRSSSASHGAGLMFPRLITAQDPFSFDCQGLDGQTPTLGLHPTPAEPADGRHQQHFGEKPEDARGRGRAPGQTGPFLPTGSRHRKRKRR